MLSRFYKKFNYLIINTTSNSIEMWAQRYSGYPHSTITINRYFFIEIFYNILMSTK